MSNRIKVCIGMLVIVILICLLFWLAPPTVVIPTLGVTTFVAVSALLWSIFLRNKRLMTIILIGSLLSIPVYQTKAQPSKENTLAVCFILGIGIVLVAGVWYSCGKIPKPGACTCGCGVVGCPCSDDNAFAPPLPPTTSPTIVTNPVVTEKASLSTTNHTALPNIQYVSSGVRNVGGSFVDVNGNPWNYLDSWSFTLQSTTNLQSNTNTVWTGEYTFNGWDINTGGVVLNVTSNGVTIYNAFYTSVNNPNNRLPLDLGLLKQKEFFRVVCR